MPRVFSLALALLLASCAAQVVAPRDTSGPSVTPQPTNAASDVLYMRAQGSGDVAQIVAIDARTGATLRTLSDGSLSFEGKLLYVPEQASGATQTVVRVLEIASGRELRSFVVSGGYRAAWSDSRQSALSRDGQRLVLSTAPVKLDGEWVTSFKVLDTASGASLATLDLRAQSTYRFLAMSSDGRSLYLNEFGSGATGIRVFDVATSTLLSASAIAGGTLTQNGYRTPGALSPDGRWMYSVDAGTPTTNCTSTDGPACVPNATPPSLMALDLASRRVQRVLLPKEQVTADFEKYLLWSVAVSPDGGALYAVNPALGVINEIDARGLTLRRTAPITVSRTDDGALAGLARFLFPVAEAKRYTAGVALTSADGTRLYAIGNKGIVVVDTASLTSSAVWERAGEFDQLYLTPDGLRLYAVSSMNSATAIVSARDGARLGELKLPAGGLMTLLRVELAH